MRDTPNDVGADEREIGRLLARYCHHYDDGRPEEFAALFTEDAEFCVFGTTRVGRAEIRARIGTRAADQPPGQHVTYNSVVDVEGDAARAWTDFLYLRKDGDGHVISNAGRYHDRLRRTPEGWRIARRTIVFLGDAVPPDA